MSITFDFAQITPDARYHIMTQCVIPRPIAWVLTRSSAGVLNLAPFSFFNAVSSDPPLLMLSIGLKSAPIAMNCRYANHSIIGAQRQYLVFVEIETIVVADACMPQGSPTAPTAPTAPTELNRVRIDPAAVDPLARLGAGFFARIGDVTKAPADLQKRFPSAETATRKNES